VKVPNSPRPVSRPDDDVDVASEHHERGTMTAFTFDGLKVYGAAARGWPLE